MAACSRNPASQQRESPLPTTSAPPDNDWGALIEAAQAEGELVIVAGSSRSRDHRPLFDEFTRRFGVTVIASAGSGSANVQRVLVERSRGRYTVDVSLVGRSSSERLREAGALSPMLPLLIHPEVVDRSHGWRVKEHVWLGTEPGYVAATSLDVHENLAAIYYNTERVTQEELAGLTSWHDFLKPQWRGRTVAIVEPSGEGRMGELVRCWRSLGSDWFVRYFRDAQPTLLPDGSERALADGLARGKYSVAIFVGGARTELRDMEEINLPVRNLLRPLSEGGGIEYSGGIALFDRAAHPNAARLFLNWYMTRDGQTARQTLLDRKFPSPSLRSDVPQGKVSDYEWGRIQVLEPAELSVRGEAEWDSDVEAVTSFVRKLGQGGHGL